MRSITGVVITLNEEANITDCLRSLFRVCAEVIVVDSGSRDLTREIAGAEGARVIEQAYLGDGPQKAFGVPYASHDWILALDADERLDEDAAALIPTLALDDPATAYGFRRKNYVGHHWIRAAGFYPDAVVRLYNRTQAGYLPKKAHSSVQAPRVEQTDAHIQHFTYHDLAHWIQRIDQLSSRDAWAMKERGVPPSSWRPTLHALSATLRKLILKGGLLQGSDGMTVAMTTAFHAYMKYAKLNELHENERLFSNAKEGKD
ncbi:glycosyltransferase family 2 protein [Pistricoccus aurantiacus]|uniref:glycosyltransferase family 2 protein n=1 Tax=Pistricoccus aurantiacus TaxID=1883414 RepID=UPI00363AC859